MAQQFYLDVSGQAAFCALHRPETSDRGVGVVLVPPFGWSEVSAHRSLRIWADWLAAAGFTALRVTLPSMGDSGGDVRDPERLGAWTEAVDAAARFLRASGNSSVAAIGVELGGLVVCRAALTGSAVDQLVLWAAPARGRTLIRHLRVVAKMEGEGFYAGMAAPPPMQGGEGLEAGGFGLSAETVAALEAYDVTETPSADVKVARAMLIGSDGRAPEDRLRSALVDRGISVTEDAGLGVAYAEMVSHPQTSVPPAAVAAAVTAWLSDEGVHGPAGGALHEAQALDRYELTYGEERLTERPITIEHGSAHLSGILAEPVSVKPNGVCLVALNAGAIHRIGPNRMWVEAARRWAARGVTALRVDLEGIGESDGDATEFRHDRAFYREEFIEQTRVVLDRLAAQHGARRFVIVGLCSGAFWGLQAALDDTRVASVLLINPRALVWDPSLAPSRDFRAFWARPITARRVLRILRSGRVRPVLSWLLRPFWIRVTGRSGRRSTPESGGDVLERVHGAGAHFHFLFSADEPLLQELRASGRLDDVTTWHNLTMSHVPVCDHTLRPRWSQEAVHTELDRMLGDACGHITTM